MNKRILSVFVFSAALLSIQAQDRKGGISDAMLNQIKQSYEGTSADKALRNAIGNNDIRKLALNRNGYSFLRKSKFERHHRPEIIRSLLAFHRTECDACQSHR